MAKRKITKKKTVAKKKGGFRGYVGSTTGLSVSDYWIKLFAQQSKAGLTDPEIAKAMAAEFPNAKRYTPKDIVVFRNRYNNGNLTGQDKAPAVRVAEYIPVPKGARTVALPMWGEKALTRKKAAPKAKKKVTKKKASKRKVTKKKVTKKKASKRK